MTKITIGGVPEHFNLPWHLGIENDDFRRNGIELLWKHYPNGTGAMCRDLRNGELDAAVILTEGIVKDITAGNPSRIVQEYIASPLIWGIHVAHNSSFQNVSDLREKSAAISRYGSGSHLMAYLNAEKQGWNPEDLEFKVIKDTNGAIDALESGAASYFMWEHFTTKPLVDRRIFRRLDDFPTPWPCFVIAVREEALKEKGKEIYQMLETINSITEGFKEIPEIEQQLAERYDQKSEDIKLWLEMTTWSQQQISQQVINRVQEKLYELNLIENKLDNHRFITHF